MRPLRTVAQIAAFFISTSGLFASSVNLAPNGTASSSSTGFGGSPELAIDGNRDGIFANGSVFHSAGGTGPGEWFEVDLGGEFNLDRILLFPRNDQFQNSVRDFTLEIFDASGAVVWTADFLPAESTRDAPWGTAAMSGQKGQRVRLTLKNPNFSAVNFLTFAELEAWGSATPLEQNIAGTATITSSTPGFGATIANGVDNDLSSHFFAFTDADGPLFHDAAAAGQGFYRLGFDSPTNFREVQLYNRVVNAAATTTLAYRVSVLDSLGALVSSQEVIADGSNYDQILQFEGAAGHSLLIEELNEAQFLAFSEVRILTSSTRALAVPNITSIELSNENAELTFQATVTPNTTYTLFRSSDLQGWTFVRDDIVSETNSATFTNTPEGTPPSQFFYLEETRVAN